MTAPVREMRPVAFKWTGEAMVPIRPKAIENQFLVGNVYWLEQGSDRSAATHSHYFAWLQEAWLTLPEAIADDYPSVTHLRKKALVATGYFREVTHPVASRKEALRAAELVRNVVDEYVEVVVREASVTIRFPRSQSMHGLDRMSRREFQESKTKVMDWVANLIGCAPEDIGRAA